MFCVCLCMHVYQCMCICRSQMLMSNDFLSQSPPSFLRQNLSLHLELMNVARPTGKQTPGSPCLCFPSAGITGLASLGFFYGCWGSNERSPVFHGKCLSNSATSPAQVLSEMPHAALRCFFPTLVVLVNPTLVSLKICSLYPFML